MVGNAIENLARATVFVTLSIKEVTSMEDFAQRCPDCGTDLMRYTHSVTGDGWVVCPECGYHAPDDPSEWPMPAS